MKHLRNAAAVLSVGALLTGCGGGSAGVDVPGGSNEVPATALASPESYTSFVASLAPSDSAEPLSLGKVTVAPSSDTLAPAGT